MLLLSIIFLYVVFEYLFIFNQKTETEFLEFPVIFGFSVFFMLLLIASFNLFSAFVCLEGLSFSLYILAGLNFLSQSSMEGGIKYFCLGALSSGLFLYGLSVVFLICGSLNFLEIRYFFILIEKPPLLLCFGVFFIFLGLFFKLSIFPCHA